MAVSVDVAAAVDAACQAPSLHHSQPGRFRVRGDTVEVRTDPTRSLSATDPSGWAARVGGGAALCNLRLAVAVQGFAPAVRRCPDRADPDLLAVLTAADRSPRCSNAMRACRPDPGPARRRGTKVPNSTRFRLCPPSPGPRCDGDRRRHADRVAPAKGHTMTTTDRTPAGTTTTQPVRTTAVDYVWGGLRLALGWIFLWAFLDKVFGWGFATARDAAWINGGSPTEGFLTHATTGPFAGFYRSFAGAVWADVLFMLGLAAIGVALLAGIAVRIAAVAGALMLVMMWTAVLPPPNNPFMDDHLVYAGLLVGLAMAGAGNTLGLGRYWTQTTLVRRWPWLA